MATSYTPNLRLEVPGATDRAWNLPLNRDLAALDACAPIAGLHAHPAEYPSTTLNVSVSAGRWRKADGSPGAYAGGTIAIPASSTRVLYLDGSGTLTAAAAYPTTWHVPIATATAGASTVTAIADDRVASQAIGVGSGGQLGGLVVATAENPSTTLNVSVSAGKYQKADGSAGSYAGATSQAVSASATTVLYLDSAGALQTAASYPATTIVRLATVVAGASSIASIVDDRVALVPTSPPGAASYLPLAGGTLTDGANVVVGASTGTKIGTSASQKLGFWGATPVARPSAYSQGYTASTRSLAGYSPSAQATSFAGLSSGMAGTVYAAVSDLNSMRASYENLRAFVENAVQMLNSVVDDHQTMGLAG